MSTGALPAIAESLPKSTTSGLAWLKPSFYDIFFLAVLAWSFLAGQYGWSGLLSDGDVGIHIRIGDHILANHHVPDHDLFSFSKPGGDWYAFEWLSEVVFSSLHQAFGLKGVVLLAGVLITSVFTLLIAYTLWRGANGLIALMGVLMAVNATSIHFHARPHIFTLLLVVIAVWMIQADRQKRSRAIWLLAPLTVVWTNLHGGFMILFSLLGLLAAGSLAEALIWRERSPRGRSDALRYTLLAAVCGAASLLNPYGIKLHEHIRETMQSPMIMQNVQEFMAPTFRVEGHFHYMALLFLGLLLCGSMLRRHHLVEVLWIAFLGCSSLVSVRHIPLYVLVSVPIIAVELTAAWQRWLASRPAQSIAHTLDGIAGPCGGKRAGLTIWIPLLLAAIALTGGIDWPRDLFEPVFPAAMVRRHGERLARARIFTTDQWGDYLIYHNYPKQRVFLDGRHNYYGAQIETDYLRLLGGHYTWREILDRYGIDTVLCAVESPLATLMKYHPGWRLVEDDGKAILFEKLRPGESAGRG